MTTLLSSSNYNANGRTIVFDNQYPWGSNNTGTMSCANAAAFITSEWGTFTTNTTDGPVTVSPVINYTNASPGQSYTLYPLSYILGTQVPQSGMASLTGYTPSGGPGTTAPITTVAADIDAVIPNCTGAGDGETCTDGSMAIAFMKNQISGCLATAGSQLYRQTGVSSPTVALPGFCLDMTNALAVQQEKNAGMASVFEVNVIPLMTILQFLFFALSPLVALMVAFMGSSGNHGVYAKYMLFGIWTESFLPVAALINDYSQFQVQNVMNAQMTAGTGVAVSNMTDFINIGSVFSHVQLALSSANMMIVAVPILTFSILTGSYYAMTKLGGMISAESSMTPEATAQVQPPKFNQSANGYGISSTGTGAYGVAASSVGIDSGYSANAGASLMALSGAAMTAAGTTQKAMTASQSEVLQAMANLTQNNAISHALSHDNLASLSSKASEMQADEDSIQNMATATNGRAAAWAHKGEIGAGLNTAMAEAKVSYGKTLTQQQRDDVAKAYALGENLSSTKAQALDIAHSIKTSDAQTSSDIAAFSQAISNNVTDTGAYMTASSVAGSVSRSAQQAISQGAAQDVSSAQAYQRFMATHKGTAAMAALNSYMSTMQKTDPAAYSMGMKIADNMPSSVSGIQRQFIAANAAMGAAVQMGSKSGASPAQISAARQAIAGYAGLIDTADISSGSDVPQEAATAVSNAETKTKPVKTNFGQLSNKALPLLSPSSAQSIVNQAQAPVSTSHKAFEADIASLRRQYAAIQSATQAQQGALAVSTAARFTTGKKSLQEYAQKLHEAAALKSPEARAQAIEAAMKSAGMPMDATSPQQIAAFASSPSAITNAANAVSEMKPNHLAKNKAGTQNAAVNFISAALSGSNFDLALGAAVGVGALVGAGRLLGSAAEIINDAEKSMGNWHDEPGTPAVKPGTPAVKPGNTAGKTAGNTAGKTAGNTAGKAGTPANHGTPAAGNAPIDHANTPAANPGTPAGKAGTPGNAPIDHANTPAANPGTPPPASDSLAGSSSEPDSEIVAKAVNKAADPGASGFTKTIEGLDANPEATTEDTFDAEGGA